MERTEKVRKEGYRLQQKIMNRLENVVQMYQ